MLSIENLIRKKNERKVFSFDLSKQEIQIFSDKNILPFIIMLLLTSIAFLIPFSWLIYNSIILIVTESKVLSYFYKASFNSMMLALLGGLLITIVAAVICFTQRVYGVSLNFLVNFAKIGYASPGIVIAIGVITTIVYLDKKIIQLLQLFNIDSIGLIISGSFLILIFAYLIRFLAVAF